MSDEQTTGKRRRKAKESPESAQGGTITAPVDTSPNPDASAVKTPISDSGRECPSPAKCAVCDGKGGECALCNGSGVMPEGATATKTVGEAMAEIQEKFAGDAEKQSCPKCHGFGTVCSGCGLFHQICECEMVKGDLPKLSPCPACKPAKEIDITVNAQTGVITPEGIVETARELMANGLVEPEAEVKAFNKAGELVGSGTVNLNTGRYTPDPDVAAVEWDVETARAVSALEQVVSQAEAEYEELKDETKKAKEHLEAKERELRSLIRWRRENKGKPQQADLFSRPADPHDAEGLTESPDKDLAPDDYKPAAAPEASSDASALMDSEPKKEEPDDETWKQVPLASLSLKPGLLAKLASPVHKDRGPIAPITTLGELTEYQKAEGSGYEKRLTDLKGIGEAAANEIGEACLQFWQERRGAK